MYEFYLVDSAGDVTHRLQLATDENGDRYLYCQGGEDCVATLAEPESWTPPAGTVFSQLHLAGNNVGYDTVGVPGVPSVHYVFAAPTSPAAQSTLAAVPEFGGTVYLLDSGGNVTHCVSTGKSTGSGDQQLWVQGPSAMPAPTATPPSSGANPGGPVQAIGVQTTDPNGPGTPPVPAAADPNWIGLIYSNVASLLGPTGLPRW